MLKKIQLAIASFLLALGPLFIFAPLAYATTDTCTWTGATNDNFNTAANWNCSTDGAAVPDNGDSLIFDVDSLSGDATLNNNISGASFANITFQGTNSDHFSIDGNSFTLTGGITDSTTSSNVILADITFSGGKTINVSDSDNTFSLIGVISGSGAISKTGSGALGLSGDNSSYSGAIIVNAGNLIADHQNALGTTSAGTTVNDGADITFNSCGVTDATFAENLTLTGDSSIPTGDPANPKLSVNVGSPCMGGGGPDETYGFGGSTKTGTLSGSITLGSDITFGGLSKTVQLTGALSGTHKINMLDGFFSKLVVNGSSNSTQTANGTYTASPIELTVSDDQASTSVGIYGNTVVAIDGKRGDITVTTGATIKGTGTVGNLDLQDGATVAPGHSPGCMNTGNLTFVSGSTYDFEVGGATACTEYDQIKVTGTVTLGNGTLNLTRFSDFKPTVGQSYTIIDNDSSDAVTGTFANLAEGATFEVDGYVFVISYVGGDGNDVTVTTQSVPAAPNTGFKLLTNNPLITLVVTIFLAGSIVVIAKRYAKLTAK